MPYAPTLTAFTDANPGVRVLVTFSALASGTQTINVYRTAEGRRFKVRGGVNLYAVGGVAVMDFEVPLGVAATYQAEQFDSSGLSLGFTDATSVTVSTSGVFTDTSQAILHQPLSPSLSIIANLDASTAADVANVVPGSLTYPEGATVGTWIGGRRQGISGLALTVKAQSYADADEFRNMFGGYTTDFPAVLCVRTAPPVRLPRVLFASVDMVHESVDYINSLVTFALTVNEVAPPAPGLIIPTLRREDLDVAYATRGAGDAAYATRLSRDTDYSKAGLAG
ncbi:excinuclease ABC subunit C [Leifsonia xyli subsp. cynodontis DSM 46306]|uniref:Uncharacterized protein n=1 Tax=Leifsonia xyli subsp. cynodontis DSM 46306 TaxID=1389489 RepID=U3P9R5_LEIXC|nr:hypothetical protein [Leifsonia xyli]AGW41746.1 excinuclease ABC subunit C [Leifsonia xyli subsp. cynodontis DSM 46306]AGW42269.1 excinuclease ABC subunit C [Leifsonia xyli subsp. cynodontis DSM 46306]